MGGLRLRKNWNVVQFFPRAQADHWFSQGAIKRRAVKRALSSCAMCDAEAD